jgi:hypothetical protein
MRQILPKKSYILKLMTTEIILNIKIVKNCAEEIMAKITSIPMRLPGDKE